MRHTASLKRESLNAVILSSRGRGAKYLKQLRTSLILACLSILEASRVRTSPKSPRDAPNTQKSQPIVRVTLIQSYNNLKPGFDLVLIQIFFPAGDAVTNNMPKRVVVK